MKDFKKYKNPKKIFFGIFFEKNISWNEFCKIKFMNFTTLKK